MDPLAGYLRSLGYHTYRTTLRGHERASPEIFDFQAWESDVVQAYREVRVRYPSLPIHILGYSLGGLLATRVVDRYPEINPKSMILLAPALSLRALVQTGLLLNLFPPLTGAVPNIAPRYYRRFARTPLFWYQNTFDLYLDTREIDSVSRLHRTKTLVLANPVDELVSYSGLSAWLSGNELANSWQIQPLQPQSRDPFSPAHLVIDKHSLGERSWRELQRAVAEFLGA
jgi:alpha-beta hydrolase superfamily lysophospholipase